MRNSLYYIGLMAAGLLVMQCLLCLVGFEQLSLISLNHPNLISLALFALVPQITILFLLLLIESLGRSATHHHFPVE
ncbi:MAG: hypothetical protein V2I33_03870 [Kangiellaceae bacterium]|jgi:hypothetical protein|nr:hypothetical protein [Kangiellaceae bacterium]